MLTGLAVVCFASFIAMWINDNTAVGLDSLMDDLGD
jgi:hypothetical protein